MKNNHEISLLPKTDSPYTSLINKSYTDSQEAATGIVLDFDSKGCLVGIDIDRGSQVIDLFCLDEVLQGSLL
ncbi:MAG: DUF2283 domain-containing protein [Cyanobacteria bacterium CAN_BIN43]|nr:DUF2283 domain-containing protein [Cyanobacteria bacterium CAN_BIN43]